MENQISEKQWDHVVAEVTRLAQAREDEATRRETTRQVLETLNLPTDLLDEAIRKVQYREAIERERKRRMLMFVIAALLAALIAFGTATWSHQRSSALDQVTASTARITRELDNGGRLSTVTRDGNEVYYRVSLQNVPVGRNLPLSCIFTDPAGKIFHQSTWKSRETDKPNWDTYCRCRLGDAAAPGAWKVELKVGDKVVTQSNFNVE